MRVRALLPVLLMVSACREAPDAPALPRGDQLTYLHLLWNDVRLDNLTSATDGPGERREDGFVSSRLEARILRARTADTVPLWLLERRGEHLTAARPGTIADALRDGYRQVAVLGFVYASPRPGLRPLRLFHSGERGDFFLTGTAIGARSAMGGGYREVGVEGWAYRSKELFAQDETPLLEM